MDKQMSLSALSDELAQVRTKKKEFLTQMDRIIPWGEWIALIRPCYYKGERGNKPYDLERMLRIYMIQNLYNLSDMTTVAEVIDSRAFSTSATAPVCPACSSADGTQPDSQEGHDCRLYFHRSTVFYQK